MSVSTKIDVRYVAHLARLSLSAEEEAQLTTQLGRILEYVAKLEEVDVGQVEPTAHAIPRVNVVRPDVVCASLAHEEAMRNAPVEAGGLFMVPRIVE